MSKRGWLAAVTAGAFVVGLLLMVGSAVAQSSGTLTHPTWVADSPTAGQWIPTWTMAAADTGGVRAIKGVRAIECCAETETKFVAYSFIKGAGTDKRKWPIFGVGVADTCYTVPAGETRTYLFDKPWVQFIIVASGTAYFSGE